MDSRTATQDSPHPIIALPSMPVSASDPPTATPQPQITITSISAIRRKPKVTYQSPSAHSPADLRIEGPHTSVSQALTLKLGSSSSAPKSNSLPLSSSQYVSKSIDKSGNKQIQKRKKHPMGPPLPLYHPLGRLALSLPPLDPTTFGLPAPLRIDDSVRRSSARARRPAAKLRDAEDEGALAVPTANTVTAVAARDVKEKPSPRKKRGSAAAAGAGAKRKRKEVDDGDATYPAKRTRNPRGAAAGNPARTPTAEAGSPTESVPPVVEVPTTPDSVVVDAQEEKKPERRSTRSRGAIARRDSSASEATATSVSVSVAASAAAGTAATSKVKSDDVMDIDTTKIPEEGRGSGDELGVDIKNLGNGGKGDHHAKEEKEDGEVSEESANQGKE